MKNTLLDIDAILDHVKNSPCILNFRQEDRRTGSRRFQWLFNMNHWQTLSGASQRGDGG
ncbi:MAG TPA: hypothetical protein VN873_19775 [Candidatus Angelobacter sp.]|nr:hypothetical protein [Candidatus Angelobacter sp.]